MELLQNAWIVSIFSGIAVMALGIVVKNIYKRSLGAKSPNKQNHTTKNQYISECRNIALNKIRSDNGVRQLLPLEDGLKIIDLPNGVYGFIVSWGLSKNLAEITIHKNNGGTVEMEIHKTKTGEIYVIGFMSQAEKIRLNNIRKTILEFHFFLEKFEEYKYLVSIPLDSIYSSDKRDIEHISHLDLKLKPNYPPHLTAKK